MDMNSNTKLYSIISYITWIGWIIALLLRDKNDEMVRHHLNQALVLNIIASIAGILGKIGGLFGVIGWVIGVACFVLSILGIIRAFKLSSDPLPVVGQIKIL